MKNKKLKILLTNDDGFSSKGFKEAIALCANLGDVVAVAPERAQSGKSAALTMEEALWLKTVEKTVAPNGCKIEVYSFSGTPADCVKIAMNTFFSRHNKPDMLFSGINHGSNASAAAIYSGTLGAAKEAALYEVPAIAFSLDTHKADASFEAVREWFKPIMEQFLSVPPSPGVYLNINFPDIPLSEIKGIKFSEQGRGMWIDEFEKFATPMESSFYMMYGTFLDLDTLGKGDHVAMKEGFISIVPHNINTTDYAEKERLTKLWKF